VEAGGQCRSLADRDDLTGARLACEDLGVLADPLGAWGTDEHAVVGAAVEPTGGRAGLEGVDLANAFGRTAVSIAPSVSWPLAGPTSPARGGMCQRQALGCGSPGA
jgi:hypothetical protein